MAAEGRLGWCGCIMASAAGQVQHGGMYRVRSVVGLATVCVADSAVMRHGPELPLCCPQLTVSVLCAVAPWLVDCGLGYAEHTFLL